MREEAVEKGKNRQSEGEHGEGGKCFCDANIYAHLK